MADGLKPWPGDASTGWSRDGLSFQRANETATDAVGCANLLEFDPVHGRWRLACQVENDRLVIDGQRIFRSSLATIGDGDWSGCDIVIEATGRHHKKT